MRLGLTKRGAYSLRILIHLALLPQDESTTSKKIAAACDIPAGNMPTVMSALVREGFVRSSPGRGGGYQLALTPEEISLLDVVNGLEGRLEFDDCLLTQQRCRSGEECTLHDAWTKSSATIRDSLHTITLRRAIDRELEFGPVD